MAEKEYIERGALLKKIFPYGLFCDGNYPVNAKSVRVAVEKAPAADVVEVVRCKDCRYFDVIIDCCTNELGMHSCCADGFCSYGERKG